jgi:hypothetical protein
MMRNPPASSLLHLLVSLLVVAHTLLPLASLAHGSPNPHRGEILDGTAPADAAWALPAAGVENLLLNGRQDAPLRCILWARACIGGVAQALRPNVSARAPVPPATPSRRLLHHLARHSTSDDLPA